MPSGRARQAQQRRIGQQWIAFRERYLFSQVQLAEALGVSRRTVQYVETGRAQNPRWTCIPSLETMGRFQALQAKYRSQERNGGGRDRLFLLPQEGNECSRP